MDFSGVLQDWPLNVEFLFAFAVSSNFVHAIFLTEFLRFVLNLVILIDTGVNFLDRYSFL